MNLVQIQERLKEMPARYVMAMANGANPEIPPAIALAELNRRNRMAQQPAQSPQGTVKDQIEGQTSMLEQQKRAGEMMQLQALRQQQMAQQSAQQQAKQPQPVPGGVPQPEMQGQAEYARGGIVDLPEANQLNYGSGGLVAFAEGGATSDPMQELRDKVSEMTKEGASQEEIAQAVQEWQAEQRAQEGKPSPESQRLIEQAQNEARMRRIGEAAQTPEAPYPSMRPAVDTMPRMPRPAPAQEQQTDFADPEAALFAASQREQRMPFKAPPQLTAEAPVQPGARSPNDVRRLDQPEGRGLAALAMPQVSAPPQAASVATMPQPAVQNAPVARMPQPSQDEMDLRKGLQALQQAPQYKSYEEMRKEYESKYPELAQKPGAALEAYMQRLGKRDEEISAQTKAAEQDRLRAALWKGLIDAGEATRGQKGIGGLMGGFGRSISGAMDANRTANIQAMEAKRAREDAMFKMKAELEAARQAYAEGNLKAAMEHQDKAKEYQLRADKAANDIRSTLAQIDERRSTAAADRASRERTAQMPGASEREINSWIADWMASNPGKSRAEARSEYYRAKNAAGERVDLAGLKAQAQVFTDRLKDPMLDPATKQDLQQQLNDVLRKMSGVTTAAAGPKEGERSTSKSGKPIIFRNGQWEYQ